MKNTVFKSLLVIFSLLVIGFVGLKIYDYFTDTVRYENSTVQKRESTETIPSYEIVEIDKDSLFHKAICFDYENGWINKDGDKNKLLLFDYYSGKLFVYNFDKKMDLSKISKETANNVFLWEEQENQKENKIIGKIGWTDKDSTMFWIYNKNLNQMKDDKGLVFEKIKIKIKK